ncbi:hypothetical protein [Hoylesella loescheii]|uniref:hypothetical protein n=1 Tax=Hoylesella loescheii TaxID=840 RepID=UPI00248DBCB4|nr:hypothetical protein [Hoylesella loescheii]
MNDKITHLYVLSFGILAKAREDEAYSTIGRWYAGDHSLGLSFSPWECLAVDFGRLKEWLKSLKSSITNHFRELTKMVLRSKAFYQFTKKQKSIVAIHKVIALCKTLKVNADYHFRELTKMIIKGEHKVCKLTKVVQTYSHDLLVKNSTFLKRDAQPTMKSTVMYNGKVNTGLVPYFTYDLHA